MIILLFIASAMMLIVMGGAFVIVSSFLFGEVLFEKVISLIGPVVIACGYIGIVAKLVFDFLFYFSR